MLINNKSKLNKGFSLLELVLAVAIFSLSSISTGYLLIESINATDVNSKKIAATLLAREGIEAIRSIRDVNGFSALDAGTGQGLIFDENTNTWSLSPLPETVDNIYTRTVDITNIEDGLIKKVTSTVMAVSGGRTVSTSLTTYFTNWSIE